MKPSARAESGAPTSGLAAGRPGPAPHALGARERRRLRRLLVASAIALTILVAAGVAVERAARTPLIRVGQLAPDFSLPAAEGGTGSLAAQRGRPVLLAFVPSVLCDFCQRQLLALQEASPALRARGVALLVVSTDTPAVQRAVADRLGLDYPILSEAPTAGQHPVGSAYGVYHRVAHHAGPVNADALVVIDAAGIVRAVRVRPGRVIPAGEILALVSRGLAGAGGDG